jgi:hypothetical protein
MEAEPTKADPPKRKRRRFQFRLRTVMVVVTLIGVWTPLLMKAGEAIHEARELARRTPCPNRLSLPWGPRFILPPPPSRPATKP